MTIQPDDKTLKSSVNETLKGDRMTELARNPGEQKPQEWKMDRDKMQSSFIETGE